MKRTFLKFPSRPVSYLPKMQNRRTRLTMDSNNACYKSGGPEDDTPKEFVEAADDTDEVKSIKMMGRQVHAFKKTLGEKADAQQFTDLNTKIDTLAKGIKDMETANIAQT